ncbi:MAG: PadR family transcriptional regulator [Candidatus Omnitrophica bacterium]|nr:PadR family transcriptional regulator [Candidatus Omnitrophota bacterium]
MIEHELLFLGLLREGPKHGYDIKIKIREILSIFAGIDLKSVYYPLRILEKRGLVTKRKIKSGRRPERIVYCLTPEGSARFEELLSESFLNFKRPQFSLDLSLYFLNYVRPQTAKRRLRARMLLLKRLLRSLHQAVNASRKEKPLTLTYILEHDLQMVETELKFLENLVRNF